MIAERMTGFLNFDISLQPRETSHIAFKNEEVFSFDMFPVEIARKQENITSQAQIENID